MEKEEKLRYVLVAFLSILSFSYTNTFSYTKGLAVDDNIHNLMLLITAIVLVLLGLVLILIALDFLVAGMVPDAIINLLTWIYVLILGVLIVAMALLNYLEI